MVESAGVVELVEVVDVPVGTVCETPQVEQVEEPPSGSFSCLFFSLLAQLRYSKVLHRLLSMELKFGKMELCFKIHHLLPTYQGFGYVSEQRDQMKFRSHCANIFYKQFLPHSFLTHQQLRVDVRLSVSLLRDPT